MDISNAKSLHSLFKLDGCFYATSAAVAVAVASAVCRHRHRRSCSCHHHRCDMPLA